MSKETGMDRVRPDARIRIRGMALLVLVGALSGPGAVRAAPAQGPGMAAPTAAVPAAHPVVQDPVVQDPAEAVMIAAGRWAMERLPSGSAVLDPHRSGAGKDGDRVRRVAEALGIGQATLEQTRQCSDAMDPSTCQLSAARLLVIGAPRISGDRAEVKVHAWHRADSPRQPVGQQEWQLTLTRSGSGWQVVGGG